MGACLLASACSQAVASESATIGSSPPASDNDATTVSGADTTVASTTTAPTTTAAPTTTTEPPLDVYDPECVVQVTPGGSLGAIAASRADEIVTVATIQAENGLTDELIFPDQLLDVCIDNGLNDITGEQRLERNAVVLAAETREAVTAQQIKLNELLTPLGFPEMPVDGISGPVTRRGLCASRLALGLPVSRDDMAPGSDEEKWFLASPALPVPPDTGTDGNGSSSTSPARC